MPPGPTLTASEAGEEPHPRPRSETLAIVGVAITVTCLVAFAALQYAMPRMVGPESGVNHAGVVHFARRLFGTSPPPMRLDAFIVCFRLFLLGSWAGYVLAV